jgi:hypothetical protein
VAQRLRARSLFFSVFSVVRLLIWTSPLAHTPDAKQHSHFESRIPREILRRGLRGGFAGHGVLHRADDGHQDRAADGRAADIAGRAGAGQRRQMTHQRAACCAAEHTDDGITDGPQAELFQQGASDVAADSAADQAENDGKQGVHVHFLVLHCWDFWKGPRYLSRSLCRMAGNVKKSIVVGGAAH